LKVSGEIMGGKEEDVEERERGRLGSRRRKGD
jgi:hypothetical protein